MYIYVTLDMHEYNMYMLYLQVEVTRFFVKNQCYAFSIQLGILTELSKGDSSSPRVRTSTNSSSILQNEHFQLRLAPPPPLEWTLHINVYENQSTLPQFIYVYTCKYMCQCVVHVYIFIFICNCIIIAYMLM